MTLEDDLSEKVTTNFIQFSDVLLWAVATTLSPLSKIYVGPLDDLVSSYGHDVALPVSAYFGAKTVLSYVLKPTFGEVDNPLLIIATGTGCLGECAQAIGAYPGVFDPVDFAAYLTGGVLAWSLEKAKGRYISTPENKSYKDVNSLPED